MRVSRVWVAKPSLNQLLGYRQTIGFAVKTRSLGYLNAGV